MDLFKAGGDVFVAVDDVSKWKEFAEEFGVVSKSTGRLLAKCKKTTLTAVLGLGNIDGVLLENKDGETACIYPKTAEVNGIAGLGLQAAKYTAPLVIDGVSHPSPMKFENNSLIDAEGNAMPITEGAYSGVSAPKMNDFMFSVTQNNGVMLVKPIKNYMAMLSQLPREQRDLLIGAVNAIDLMRTVQPELYAASSAREGYAISGAVTFEHIRDESSWRVAVHGLTGGSGDENERFPYLFLGTKPIVINGKTVPYLTINAGGLMIYVSPVKLTNATKSQMKVADVAVV